VPYRGSVHDVAALRLARRVADESGAKITVLRFGAEGDDDFEGVTVEKAPDDLPVETVITKAKDFDLLLVGIGREWGLEPKTFGRRAEGILERAPTSVVVVRHGEGKGEHVPEAHRARYTTVSPPALRDGGADTA
jgi:nucleotide-binding universal stress UspA family protein